MHIIAVPGGTRINSYWMVTDSEGTILGRFNSRNQAVTFINQLH